jgi:hypothetical protein
MKAPSAPQGGTKKEGDKMKTKVEQTKQEKYTPIS